MMHIKSFFSPRSAPWKRIKTPQPFLGIPNVFENSSLRLTPFEFWKRASAIPFQRELNRLFWIDEFEIRDTFEPGWSCREHAWAMTLLARSVNLPAFIMNGALTHVFPSPDPGLINNVETHSWVAIEGQRQAYFDFSQKPTLRDNRLDTEHPIPKIAYSQPIPAAWGNFVMTHDEKSFVSSITAATEAKRPTALYFGNTFDTPFPEIIENACGYINSPLTDQLRESFGDDIYAKGLLHLHEILFSRRKSDRNSSRSEVWARIESDFADAVPRALRLAKLA